MSKEAVYHIFEIWKSKGKVTFDMAREIERNFDVLMDTELEEVGNLLSKDEAEAAFLRLTRLTSFINAVAGKLPSIIDKLKKWVNKVKSQLKSAGKKLGADRFGVSVGLPFGGSISLYFPIS